MNNQLPPEIVPVIRPPPRLVWPEQKHVQKQAMKSRKGLAKAKSTPEGLFTRRQSRAERHAMGKKLRDACPREAHAHWKAPAGRPDPVSLLLEADKGRIPELLPLRHGRMALSPFTFYRGSALNMAVDLATTPATGVRVQCCGDAHLGNFRGLGTPERRVIFAINDLDENSARPVGVEPQATRGELRGRLPEQLLKRIRRQGCGPHLCPLIP